MKLAFIKDHRTRGNKINNTYFTSREFKLINNSLDYVNLDINPQLLFWEDYTTIDEVYNDLESHVLVTLGSKVTKEFLNRTHTAEKIDNLRGRYYFEKNTFIVPTYEPYKVLRSPNLYFNFLDDVQRIKKVLNMKKPEEYFTNLIIIDTVEKAKHSFKELTGTLSSDIETQGLNFMLDKIIAFGIGNDKKQYIYTKELFENNAFITELKIFMERPDTRFIWHNGKFDTKFFMYQYNINADVDEDTLLLNYAMDSRRGIHGLKELSEKYFNAPDYDKELKSLIPKDGNFDDVPKDILHEYLGFDVIYTHKLWIKLNELVDKRALYLYKELLLPSNYFLRDVELNGLKPDIPYLNKLKKEYETELTFLENKFDKLVKEWNFKGEDYMQTMGAKTFKDDKFNINSVNQVRYVIFHIIGLPSYKNSDTTNAEARQYWLNYLGIPKLQDEEDPDVVKQYKADLKKWKENPVNDFVFEFDRYKFLKKAYSSYVKGYLKNIYPDGRLHSSFLIHGTETGRLSSANPNIQNIPKQKKLKNIITVEDGNILIECDYSQAELRVLADLSNDEFLIDTYKNDKDLHYAVAQKVFKKDKVSKVERNKAKTVNFGLAYGRGASSLAEMFHMEKSEAQQIIDDWFAEIPTAGKFINTTRLNPIKNIPTITPLGRKREFGLITNSNRYNIENEAINTPIQSIASDMTLISGIQLNTWLNKTELGKIVNIVHDALLIEVKPENVDTVIKKTLEIMEKVPQEYINAKIPFKSDAEVCTHWGNKIDWKEGMDYDICR